MCAKRTIAYELGRVNYIEARWMIREEIKIKTKALSFLKHFTSSSS